MFKSELTRRERALEDRIATLDADIDFVRSSIYNLPGASGSIIALTEFKQLLPTLGSRRREPSCLPDEFNKLAKAGTQSAKRVDGFDCFIDLFRQLKVCFCDFDDTVSLIRPCAEIEDELIQLSLLHHKATCVYPQIGSSWNCSC